MITILLLSFGETDGKGKIAFTDFIYSTLEGSPSFFFRLMLLCLSDIIQSSSLLPFGSCAISNFDLHVPNSIIIFVDIVRALLVFGCILFYLHRPRILRSFARNILNIHQSRCKKKKRLNESSKPEKREHNYVEDMTKKGGQLL